MSLVIILISYYSFLGSAQKQEYLPPSLSFVGMTRTAKGRICFCVVLAN